MSSETPSPEPKAPVPAPTKKCIDCALPIPEKANVCTNDNCGAFQDWRRFIGAKVNIIFVATFLGVLVSLILNIQNVFHVNSVSRTVDEVKYVTRLQAIAAFRDGNMAYYDDATELINLNFSATSEEESEGEKLLWFSHANGHGVGGYNWARNRFDALNDLYDGQLDQEQVEWQNAMTAMYKLNGDTYDSRGKPTWHKKVGKKVEDTQVPKEPTKEAFFASTRYKNVTAGFKAMVDNVVQKAKADIRK